MHQLLLGSVGRESLVALFDPDGPDPARLRPLTATAAALGPDGPPVRAALQGEIFNLAELAKELDLPPGTSAEEVLAAGYARWERDVLPRLRGSYVVALVDVERRRAWIAGDQGGGHSVYFHADGDRLAVASEIRPLLALLPTRPAPDPIGVVHWFSDDAAPLGRTLYEGIEELPGGEALELSATGWTRTRYWQPTYEPPDPSLGREEAAELLWSALVAAVGRRLGTEDRVGVIMSAGVDSSAVAAAAVAAGGGERLHGYSAVFPGYGDDRVDESERIDLLVSALGIENTQVRVEPRGSFALSLEWLRTWDVPLGGPGYVLERSLLEAAAEVGIDAVLDGQSGDEGFSVSPFWTADLLRRGRVLASIRAAGRLPDGSGSWRDLLEAWRSYALLGALPAGLHQALRTRGNLYRHVPSFLTPAQARRHVETDEIWAWKRRPGPAWFAERAFLLTADRHAIGVGDYTRRRATLAGVKARPPLLDPDLIECLLRIPPELGFDPVFNRVLIRQALAGRVPDAIRLGTLKSHLGAFFYDIVSGSDLEPIRKVLGRPGLEVGAYAKVDTVRRMIDHPPPPGDPGRIQWMIDVWRLATAECWLQDQHDPGLVDGLLAEPLSGPRWSSRAPA